ncbi:hypothetical protein LDENG_00248640 [Lucifuga dentata]|nr:hypothetical protein LDENG_00248640 [Lucifuga dentata]
MDITVIMLNGTTRTLRVQPWATVGSLKNLICQNIGVQPENQTLFYDNGQKITLSDNSKLVSDYGVESGSTLSLLVTKPTVIQVFLRNEKGKTTTYDVSLGQTVGDFKKQVESREGVPARQQRLVHESNEMQNDLHKLSDYNVREHSTIHLTFHLRGG